MTRDRRVLVAAVLACTLCGGRAAAQSPAASAVAEKLFREGKTLFAAGDYDRAIEKFRASEEVEPSVGVLLSLGDAYRSRGKVASAWGAYVAARDLAKTKNDARVTDADQRAAEVSTRLPHLTIRVASAADVTVTDNGLALPPASFGSPLPVDPGPHAIVASARGRRTYRVTQVLTEGQGREVSVPVLDPEEAAGPLAPPEPRRGDTQRTVGTAMLVGGGAVTAVGLVFGALAIGKWHTATTACPGMQCDSGSARDGATDDAKSADRLALVSTVGVGVGVAALAIGLVLRLTAPSSAPAMGAVVGDWRFGVTGMVR